MQNLTLRCYAFKKDNKYYACCIDLNLVDQSDSMSEVIRLLTENIQGYLNIFIEKPELYDELIPRLAPLSYRIQYYWINIKLGLHYLLSRYTDQYKSFLQIWDQSQLRMVGA